MTDEGKLFEDARRGDEAALSVLLQKYLPDLHTYVRLRLSRKLKGREDTVDIVQSVCRDVLQNAGQFTYEGEPQFRAWLFTTALRKIVDRAEYWGAAKRDLDKQQPLTGGGSKSGANIEAQVLHSFQNVCSPSGVAMGREMLARVEAAFSALPEDYQEVILLAKVVGLPRTEIAKRMNRTEASIRNLLPRALAELAERADQ